MYICKQGVLEHSVYIPFDRGRCQGVLLRSVVRGCCEGGLPGLLLIAVYFPHNSGYEES